MAWKPKRYKLPFFYPAGTRELTDEEIAERFDLNDPIDKLLYEKAIAPDAERGHSIPTREDGLVPWGDVYETVMADNWRDDRPEALHWSKAELEEALLLCFRLKPKHVIPFIQKFGPDWGFTRSDYDDHNKEQVILAIDEIVEPDKPLFLAELRTLVERKARHRPVPTLTRTLEDSY